MLKKPETWCIFAAFMFTLLAMKPSGFRKIEPIPTPRHIFQKGTHVLEFVDGNMLAVEELLKHRELDFVMVMFYAHWDGTSLATALEFEKVAREMSPMDVTFLAVNCWWPYGECAHHHVLNYYPMITVIHQTLGELEYTGILNADSMMLFLRRIMNPFRYITDEKGLQLFTAEHEVSVIGYFNFTPDLNATSKDPDGYVSFVKASVRAIVKDPINPIAFGVVTTERLARRVSLAHPKDTILKMQLNVSLVYPNYLAYKSNLIVSWAYRHRQQAVSWLVPTLRKSLVFSNTFSKGPTLLMFTPHQEENTFDNNFHLLRTVSLDYGNCNNSSGIWDAIRTIHSEARIHKSLDRIEIAPPINGASSPECCSTLSSNQRIEYIKTSHYNTCEVCEHTSRYHAIHTNNCNVNSAGISKSLESFGARIFSGPNLCLNWLNTYNPFSEIRVCCKNVDVNRKNLYHDAVPTQACNCNDVRTGRDIFDHNSQRNLNENNYSQQSVYTQGAHKWSEFTGLGCRTNKTLAFYSVRSDMFWSVAEHLGLSESNDGMKVSVVIIDYKDEMQHVLSPSQTLSVDSLRTFILKYTNNNLRRFLRSTPRINALTVNSASVNAPPHEDSSSSSIFIQEVTTDTFHEVVLNNTQKDVMLLYYAPWCGYCFRIYHLYLSFANLLQNVGLHGVLVSRIDGDANDLPWQFTVSTYPTIIFFPVGQSNDSVKLPEIQQITLLRLVKFTLQHTTKSI